VLDLKRYDTRPAAEEGRWLTLKDPETGAELPARILLKGTDSQAYKEAMLAQRRARLEHFDKTGGSRQDPAATDAEDLERLVAVTASWENITLGDEDFPCTPANARELYTGWPEFKSQIVAFIAQRANFLPRSASGS
jgi:hypothetical protein